MDSSDLFSHPYEPEFIPNGVSSTGPVQAPIFSDRPKEKSSADVPPSC
jgi:hypothetical protein